MNESIYWWNSLKNEERQRLIEKLWQLEGNPPPIEKKIAVRSRSGRIPIDGWSEKRRMLSAFPGSSVSFDLYDGDKYTGICVMAGMEDTRQEVIEQALAEYAVHVGGKPPNTCRLRYTETS